MSISARPTLLLATAILCDLLPTHVNHCTVHFPFSTCFSIIFHSYYYYVANGTIHKIVLSKKRYVALYMSTSSRSHSPSLSPTKNMCGMFIHILFPSVVVRICFFVYNVYRERVTVYISAINLSEIMNLLFAKIIFIFMLRILFFGALMAIYKDGHGHNRITYFL